MSVSDYPMDQAIDIECPECGRTAAMVIVETASEKATFIKCYRCGHESEEIDEFEEGADHDDDEE